MSDYSLDFGDDVDDSKTSNLNTANLEKIKGKTADQQPNASPSKTRAAPQAYSNQTNAGSPSKPSTAQSNVQPQAHNKSGTVANDKPVTTSPAKTRAPPQTYSNQANATSPSQSKPVIDSLAQNKSQPLKDPPKQGTQAVSDKKEPPKLAHPININEPAKTVPKFIEAKNQKDTKPQAQPETTPVNQVSKSVTAANDKPATSSPAKTRAAPQTYQNQEQAPGGKPAQSIPDKPKVDQKAQAQPQKQAFDPLNQGKATDLVGKPTQSNQNPSQQTASPSKTPVPTASTTASIAPAHTAATAATQPKPTANVPPQQPATTQKPIAQQASKDQKPVADKSGTKPTVPDKGKPVTQPIVQDKGQPGTKPTVPDKGQPVAAQKGPVVNEPPKIQAQAQSPSNKDSKAQVTSNATGQKVVKGPSITVNDLDPKKDQKPQQPPGSKPSEKPYQSAPVPDKKVEQPKDPKAIQTQAAVEKKPATQVTNQKTAQIPDPNASLASVNKSILSPSANPSQHDEKSNKDSSMKKEVKFFDDNQSPQKAPPGPGVISPSNQKAAKPGEEVANKYSLSASEQNTRLKQWHQNMKAFKLFNDAKLPSPSQPDTKLYGISLSEMNPPFQMPQNTEKFKYQDPKYLVDLQANCTLCDPSTGLYGRTVVCKSGEPVKPTDLKMQQWLLFMSDLKIDKTFLLCEIIINIYDKDELKVPVSNIVVGVAAVRILEKVNTLATFGKNKKVPIHITTPRLFVIFEENQTIENKLSKVKASEKGYQITVDVHEFKDKGPYIQDIKKFLQKNCIVGNEDLVPGFKGNRIPPVLTDDCLKNIEFDPKSKVWAHKIKLGGLDQIDQIFEKYLDKSTKQAGYKARILSRKLTVTSSNSCFLMTQSQTSISLKQSKDKKIEQPEEVLHIPNLVANSMTCLVFRVSYKVEYNIQSSDGNKTKVVREFVLGRHPFFLNFDQVGGGIIKDRLVSFNLTMCPELSIIKDLLWDPNQSSTSAVDLVIKLQMFLSNFEDLKKEEEDNKLQDELQVKMLEMEKKQQLEKSGIDMSGVGSGGGQMSEEYIKKLTETETALRKSQIENQRLQKEMEKAKDRQASSKMASFNLGMDDNKEKTKPVDVPLVDIPQVNQFAEPPIKTPPNKMLEILISRDDTDVKQLTELLQRLLNQTKGNQDVYSDVIQRLEGQIIRMLDKDPQSQMTMFGTTGRFKALQFNNLPDKDKRAILQESSRGTPGKAPSMAPEQLDISKFQIKPKMKLELDDFLRASEISIKFVVFKTPTSMNRDIRMPKKVYFTTKFFTQRQSQTGHVVLRLEKSVAANLQKQQAKEKREALDSNANPEGQLMANQQYFLMRQKFIEDGKSKQKIIKTAIDAEYEAYKNDLQLKFDFDPSMDAENQKAEEEQHRIFCEYLYSRNLTIDVWDGDSMMHFGSCKIPLALLMRQGQAKITVGQEFDVVDPIYTQRVGGLQLVITNQGRQIHKRGKSQGMTMADGSHPSKTVVKSVPMEPAQIQKTLKQHMQDARNENIEMPLDEDAKKKYRLQRIKQRQMAQGINLAQGLIDAKGQKDESQIKTANRIQQEQQLQMINELRKKTKMDLFQKIGATAKSNDIITMQVISGEVGFQQLTVKNPYDATHNFEIKITDADLNEGRIQQPEFQLVDGEEWKFWYEQGKCEQQENYHYVSAKDGRMKLEAGKQVKILFKFLSLREPIVEYGRKSKEEPAGVISHELRPRSIKVEILYKDQAVQSQYIDIKPREMICDQVFRYYLPMQQPENPVLSSIKVPNVVMNQGPFEKDLVPLNKLNIVCSNQEFKFEKTEDDGITYQVKCGKSMSVTTGFIYIYKDKKQSELLGACKVEVHACVYIQCQGVQAGVKFDINLNIVNPVQMKDPSKNEILKRKVELFSSNTQLVFSQNGRRSLHLLKEHRSAIQPMPISVRTMNMDKNSARVTAVDIDTHEIIQQYMIEVQASKPKVNDVKVINCPIGQLKPYFFDWVNPITTHKMVFSIASSNSNLIKPTDAKMEFGIGERKSLRFHVQPQLKQGTFEAQIVINTQQPDLGTNDQSKPKPDAAKLPEHHEVVIVQIVVVK